MLGFADETYIEVSSGHGGAGCVSFRREKYVPRGGPDGGDGGRGGDVAFIIQNNLKTLLHLKQKRVFKAPNGQPGQGRRKHGRDGESVVIPVPPGTLIKDPETGKLVKDLTGPKEWTFLRGGKGGRGNWHFSSSVKQTPRYAQSGLPGKNARLCIELNLIADAGFVGFPNAGKSSLLAALTNAHPKIGDYPFTTTIPHLGVLNYHGTDIVLADIPGIIQGASQGAGLGIKFLKHIYRTKVLVFMTDLSEPNFLKSFDLVKEELGEYAPELLKRPRLLVGSKLDLHEADLALARLRQAHPREIVCGISAFGGKGLSEFVCLLAGVILGEE